MKLENKNIVITGGGSGIGRAMAIRFARENAAHVIIADKEEQQAQEVAAQINKEHEDRPAASSDHELAISRRVDVSDEQEVVDLIASTEIDIGPIDLFCSNAGIGLGRELFDHDRLETLEKARRATRDSQESQRELEDRDARARESLNREWDTIWKVNTMAHVYAARELIPRMILRGGGYLLNTASAAGLLTQADSVTYAVTKHAAVALAEWIAIRHNHEKIKVSVLCPQAVDTPMLAASRNDDGGIAGVDGVVTPEHVADTVVQGIDKETFLILPHPIVLAYMQRKTGDYDRWLQGMERLWMRYAKPLEPSNKNERG